MASSAFDLTRLGPDAFEHMANALAIHVLGSGLTTFSPGPDGGRDGYFVGEAPYPSTEEHWGGVWFVQSKFHAPHLSKDAQKWLIAQVKEEITAFLDQESKRRIPNNWIIVTNIDPSGAPETGAYDAIMSMIDEQIPQLSGRVAIWGGSKVIVLLSKYETVARRYGLFITPGEVLDAIYSAAQDQAATVTSIVRHLIVTQFVEQQHTKLEQAGSSNDKRPGLHQLFADVPFSFHGHRQDLKALRCLIHASAENHQHSYYDLPPGRFTDWESNPSRARVIFIRGGPGQGKSTLTQYLAQLNRARLLDSDRLPALRNVRHLVQDVKREAQDGVWPERGRVPITVELRNYAQWFGRRASADQKGLLTYICDRIGAALEEEVLPGTLKRAFSQGLWLFVFDGLDEVPSDTKDDVAHEIIRFTNGMLVEIESDALVVATSRPQGYSGQFSELTSSVIDLVELTPAEALACARPVLTLERAQEDADRDFAILQSSLQSPTVREIMTTPLQSHIMAVVIREGGPPPERRWALFENFYSVIWKREANRELPDPVIARLLREERHLIKSIHNRLGFELHRRAETSAGAQTSLGREDFRKIVSEAVSDALDHDNLDVTVDALLEATTERLVLVSTPDQGDEFRFDIRPLQEFFASEYMYETAPVASLLSRMRLLVGDSHWAEVSHFLFSALIEQSRQSDLAVVAQALRELDEGELEEPRTLARALCRGGAVVSRLAREGVLESTKSVRAHFRLEVETAAAATAPTFFSSLIKPTRASHWLKAICSDIIRTNVPDQNFGAACIAAYQATENDAEPIADAFLRNSSPDYRGTFYRRMQIGASSQSQFSPIRRAVNGQPNWVSTFLFDELLKEDWRELEPEEIQTLYQMIRFLAERGGIPDEFLHKIGDAEASFIRACFVESFQQQSDKTSERSLHNLIIGRPLQSSSNFLADARTFDAWHRLSSVGGVIGRCTELVMARNGMTQSELTITIEEADCLPTAVVRYALGNQIDEVDTWEKGLVFTVSPQNSHYEIYTIDDSLSGTPDWAGVVNQFPYVGYCQITQHNNFLENKDFDEFVNTDHGIMLVVNALKGRPGLLFSTFHTWGIAEDKSPLFTQMLKNLACSADHEAAIRSVRHYSGIDNLPSIHDTPQLLPHALAALTTAFTGRTDESKASLDVHSFNEAVMRIAPDLSWLEMVNETHGFNEFISVSVSLARLAHAVESRALDNVLQTCRALEGLNRTISRWAAPAAFLTLSPLYSDFEEQGIQACSSLLDSYQSDLRTRLDIDEVLMLWREIDRAPVSRLGEDAFLPSA